MAIAFDAATSGGTLASSPGPLEWSHTCTGSNGILFVLVTNGSTVPTGVTYNGVALTKDVERLNWIGGDDISIWRLNGPASGANTVSVSWSGNQTVSGYSQSYTGAAQTGQPDATGSNSSASTTSLTVNTTTVADNCWIVSAFRCENPPMTAGTNTTQRLQAETGFFGGDTNAAQTPAGTYGQTTTQSPAGAMGGATVSFSPAAVTTALKDLIRTPGVVARKR